MRLERLYLADIREAADEIDLFLVDFIWEIVWVTATHDVPILRDQIFKILSDEFGYEG